jgi:hypothetical protein
MALALAVVCLPLLPEEHLHRSGIEGRTTALVHAHASGELNIVRSPRGASSLTTSHGNHGLAVFLSAVYTSAPRATFAAMALMNAGAITQPVFGLRSTVAGVTLKRIHGPPGRVRLTRGPPFLS